MQAPLVPEIVVKHRFVRVRRLGNFLRARTFQPLRGKLPLGRGQNAPRRRRVFCSSASASHICFRSPNGSCIPLDIARPPPRRAEALRRSAAVPRE